MINPYDGTIGMLFDKRNLITKLNQFVINVPGPHDYEISVPGVEVVCLLGQYEEENDIPAFNHPFVYLDYKGRPTVAADFRIFTKSKLSDVVNIYDALSDKINGNMQIIRTLLTAKMVVKDNSIFNSLSPYVSEMFASLLDTVVSLVVYDKQVVDPVHITGLLHYYSNDLPDNADIDTVLQKLPVKELQKLRHGNLKDLYNQILLQYENGKLKIPSKLISDLVDNIKVISNNRRLEEFTIDILVPILSKTIFLTNSTELAVVMTEHKPTLFAVIYTMLTSGIGNKSMMRKVIEGRKLITKPKEFSKILEQYLKDNLRRL